MEGDIYLVIDATAEGFKQYRSLMSDPALESAGVKWADVPKLGNHRLFSAAAIRGGLGKPVISRVFPISLWHYFDDPVRHFLLQGSELVGAAKCPPVHPDVPSRREMDDLVLGLASRDDVDAADHGAALRKLGLYEAFEVLPPCEEEYGQQGRYGWDWFGVLSEIQSALYDIDIEKSLHLQAILDMYPLHKRVLGLVEHVIVKQIDPKSSASAVFSDTYAALPGICGNAHPCCRRHNTSEKIGWEATLETEGNWLIFASETTSSGNPGPLDLARLLDEVVARASQVSNLSGLEMPILLADPSAGRHAKQMAMLRDRQNPAAALMSLYLGKTAIMLRNAIEHGSDEISGDGLLIDCSGYWDQCRPPRSDVSIPEWDLGKSGHIGWRSNVALQSAIASDPQAKLNGSELIPDAARSLLLTRESLGRCLTLVSLVLASSDRHLGLGLFTT